MTQSDPIQEIRDLLQKEYIRERKQGVQRAADLLAQGMYREQLRSILEKTAQGDLISGVAKLAKQVLDEDDQRHESYPPRYKSKGNEHIVGTICSKGHPNYYDKRVICRGEERFRNIRTDGVEIDLIRVRCQKCGEEMKIEVDCEGYK